VFAPGKAPDRPAASSIAWDCVPWVNAKHANGGAYNGKVLPMNGNMDANGNLKLPCEPYADPARDSLYMTTIVGTATIAAGLTTNVPVQSTMGTFDTYYVEIYAVDSNDPQLRQRVLVGRWFVGDCPGDCRTAAVFSDVYEAGGGRCCNGRPLRMRSGRVNEGDNASVEITNPNAAGSVDVQIILHGYCHRGACAC